jgi:hypothetical protein
MEYTRASLPAASVLGIGLAVLLIAAGCTPPEPHDDASPANDEPPVARIVTRAHIAIDDALAGWIETGVELAAGDAVALFGDGAMEAEGTSIDAGFLLWYRIGDDGDAVNFFTSRETFVAAAAGELFVTLRPPGLYWEDARGTFPEGFGDDQSLPVDLTVEVVRFAGPLREGLAALAATGDADASAALRELDDPRVLPEGFEPLPFLGRSGVWQNGTAQDEPGIHADTDDDTEIVRMAVDLPLTANTEFDFRWRYDALPALGPETEAQFHDYLSVALEFDNGQDLTWMWAKHVDAGTHFGCPLPWWDTRETHWVLQNGTEGLGSWHTHTRNVLADYEASIDLPPPQRIVGVWFIANSLFGRQRGAASFADVVIRNGESRTIVFAEP